MSDQSQSSPRPEPSVDDGVERAPGGADAALSESDVGAATGGSARLTPDQPMAAQTENDAVPDEIQEPEAVDEPGDQEAQENEPSD